jgi:hypothetical protein
MPAQCRAFPPSSSVDPPSTPQKKRLLREP